MSALVTVGFCAASGGATFGFVLGSMLASGKLRDAEIAYSLLSESVREFLRTHLEGNSPLVPIVRDDLLAARRALRQADVMAGLRPATEERY